MDKKGLGLVFGTALISGVSIFLNKFAVKGVDSSVFAFSKNIVVAVALVALILGTAKRRELAALSRRQWGQLALIGLVGGSIPFLLYFRGLQLSNAASAGFLHKTMFLYVAVLAGLFLKEKLPKWFAVSALLLLAGNFILANLADFSFGAGEALILGATVLWAAENTLSKHVLKDMSGTVVAFGRMAFGAVFIFLYLLAVGKAPLLAAMSGAQWTWILFTAALLMGFVLTWYVGLKSVPVSVAACILLLGSPVTTLLQFADGTPTGILQVVGMAAIAAGLVLLVRLMSPQTGARPVDSP